MVVEFDEFKGNKMIVLKRNDEDPYPFKFGKNKAKMLVENFEAVKKFAEEEDEEQE
ncbi:MAG: hypothetical protein ACOCU6_02020 [Nanoarchaeota archaeon]